MGDLIRDTVFGHLVRLISRRKLLRYPDEDNISLQQQYIKEEIFRFLNAEAVVVNGEMDRSIVNWYGPTDPENPQNWSSGKKLLVTSEICFLNFAVYVGSAIYSAGEADVMADFGVSEIVATLGLVLFVIGYGVGPMLWSPISEIPQIGRNHIYIGTLTMFVLLQVPTALSVNIGMLLSFRFITGFFGSPALATGGATIADMYKPSKRAYGIAIWGGLGVGGPTVGPVIGGFAAQAKGWTWTIWELMWLSGFTLVILICLLPETSSANILHRRAQRLRKLTGNPTLKCESDIIANETSLGKNILFTVGRAFSLSFQEPVIFLLNLYTALVYGLLYVWFESFAIVFRGIYGFDLGEEGLSFLGLLVGSVVAVPAYLWYYHRYIEPQIGERGELKPEERLPPAFVGAFCVPICLFWFGWTSKVEVHWIVPIVGSGFFRIGIVLLFNPVLNYLGDAYPAYAASVFARNCFMRASFGAAFPLFSRSVYSKLGTGGASSLLGGLATLFVPIPFALYYYGSRIRHASKRARHDV